jgi:hypothetical protein
MNRLSMGILAAVVTAGAVGCSQNGFEPIAVTQSASVVASCEKVADITIKPNGLETDNASLLQRKAREKGANTLLVASNDATSGTAYRCEMPALDAAKKSSSSSSSR